MNATPTPRDVATGHVDVDALRRQEETAAGNLAEGTFKVVRDEAPDVTVADVKVTPFGRKLMATTAHIEGSGAPEDVKAAAHELALAALAVAARLAIDPDDLRRLQDGAVVYYETEEGGYLSRNVMVRDKGAWWVAGSAKPICDVDLTPEYVAAIRAQATMWLVRA